MDGSVERRRSPGERYLPQVESGEGLAVEGSPGFRIPAITSA